MDFSLLTSKNWKDRVTFYKNFDWQCDDIQEVIKTVCSESIVPALEPALLSILKCPIMHFENTKPILKNVSNIKLKNIFFLYFEKAIFYELYKITKTLHTDGIDYGKYTSNENVNEAYNDVFYDYFVFLNDKHCNTHTKKIYKKLSNKNEGNKNEGEVLLHICENIKTQKNGKIALFYCELLCKITRFIGPIYDINIVNVILQHADPLVRKEGIEICVLIYSVINNELYDYLVNVKEMQVKEIKERISKKDEEKTKDNLDARVGNRTKDSENTKDENRTKDSVDIRGENRTKDSVDIRGENRNKDVFNARTTYGTDIAKLHSNVKPFKNTDNYNKCSEDVIHSDNNNKNIDNHVNSDGCNNNASTIVHNVKNNMRSTDTRYKANNNNNITYNNNENTLSLSPTFLDTQLYNTYKEKHMQSKNIKLTIDIPENIKTELKSSNYKERLNALQNILKFPYKMCYDTIQQITMKINDPNLQVTMLAIESVLQFNINENTIKLLVDRLKEKKLKDQILTVMYLKEVKCKEINCYLKNQKNPQIKTGILEYLYVVCGVTNDCFEDVMEDVVNMTKDCNKDVRMKANECIQRMNKVNDKDTKNQIIKQVVNNSASYEIHTKKGNTEQSISKRNSLDIKLGYPERKTNNTERNVVNALYNNNVSNTTTNYYTVNTNNTNNTKYTNCTNNSNTTTSIASNTANNPIRQHNNTTANITKRKRNDAIIKNTIKNRTKDCKNKEKIFHSFFMELLNKNDVNDTEKVLTLFDCSDRMYLSDFIIEYIQINEKQSVNGDKLYTYLNNLMDYYIENEHILNKHEIGMVYQMVGNKDSKIKEEIFDKLKYVYPESKLNKIIKKNEIEVLNSSLLVCNIKCDSPCKKVKNSNIKEYESIKYNVNKSYTTNTSNGDNNNTSNHNNTKSTTYTNDCTTFSNTNHANVHTNNTLYGKTNNMNLHSNTNNTNLHSNTNNTNLYGKTNNTNLYSNTDYTTNHTINNTYNHIQQHNTNHTTNHTQHHNKSTNYNTNITSPKNIDTILLDLIHSDKSICYNSFVNLNQIIENNVNLLYFQGNSLVSSILIQINDNFEMKNENIYIIFECFSKIMKNESFVKELSKLSIRNIILECTRLVVSIERTNDTNERNDIGNTNKSSCNLHTFVKSSASQVLLDILYNPNLSLNLEVLLDLLIYYIQKSNCVLEKDVISKLIWRHSKFCKSHIKDKEKVQEIIKVIEHFYENNCGKVLKSDIKMCKVIQLHLIEIYNEYKDDIYNFEFGSFVKRIVDKIGISKKNSDK